MSFRDLSEQLFNACSRAFGEEVDISMKGNGPVVTTGIFTHDYQLIQEPGMDSSLSTGISAVEIPLKGMNSQPMAGDKVKVRGVNYTIVEVRPNYQGQVKLILKKLGGTNEQKKFNQTQDS